MSVGRRIYEARYERLGLTQKELAERLGIDQVNISRWERGVAEPRIRYVREIAEMVGQPVSWFFADNGEQAA